MARRKTYQRGSVQLRNGEWTLRYREFNHEKNSWALRREKLVVSQREFGTLNMV
jgi:hypothetical protein